MNYKLKFGLELSESILATLISSVQASIQIMKQKPINELNFFLWR